ncbi:hypothetical protein BGW80DRAFT_1207036 [Lactifluus volemus]|nr:hypothetical protein BGW80DRAFT_1207036 [Lactifluus volemus]
MPRHELMLIAVRSPGSQFLIPHEAQQVHYYGLPANLALDTVTTLLAQVLGLEHRIGYVKEGKCQYAYYGDRRHAVGSLTSCLSPRLGCWGQSVEKKTMALAARFLTSIPGRW